MDPVKIIAFTTRTLYLLSLLLFYLLGVILQP